MVISGLWKGWEILDQLGADTLGTLYVIKREAEEEPELSLLRVVTIPRDNSDIDYLLGKAHSPEAIRDYYKNFIYNLGNEGKIYFYNLDEDSWLPYLEKKIMLHDDGIGWDALIRMDLTTTYAEYSIDKRIRRADLPKIGKELYNKLNICEE